MAVSGLSTDSFTNMQLDAGVFLADVDLSGAKSKKEIREILRQELETLDNCLGATDGGGSFTAEPEVREIEADGMRSAIVGSTVIDSWEIKIESTFKEITSKNLARALITSEKVMENGVEKIKLRTSIKRSDYIKNLCWVGDMLGGGYILIKLENVLNVSGANFTFTDKGEGSIPMEFKAHQANLRDGYAPFEIIYLDGNDEESVVNQNSGEINTKVKK
jgi:hypothetical protein